MRAAWTVALLTVAATQAVAQTRPLEVWGGGGLGMGKRNAAWSGSVGSASGVGLYLQGGARYRVVSVQARLLSTEFQSDSGGVGEGKVSSTEIYASLGPSAVGLDVGLGQRSYRGALAKRVWSYGSVGGRVELPIGSSGFTAGASLHLYVSGKESGGSSKASGRAGETTLRFRPGSTPLYLLLGYRIEQFTVAGSPDSPEDLATVVLGGGLRF